MTELLKNYPYRLLIIDDDQDNCAIPMKAMVKRVAKKAGYTAIDVQIAPVGDDAKKLLAQSPFHIVSLDMRFPERQNEQVSINTGISLAKSVPFMGFPKTLIYSQTLNLESSIDETVVLQIKSLDRYAKGTGGEADKEQRDIETLSVVDLAARILEYLNPDLLVLSEPHTQNELLPEYQTMLGSYLQYGKDSLPPPLAKPIKNLLDAWEDSETKRVDAAMLFIENTVRLALLQCVVLQSVSSLPEDNAINRYLSQLRLAQFRIAKYNFAAYLSVDALTAFDELFNNSNPTTWQELRVPLQYAMDVAAYWVAHPLYRNLHTDSSGWTAELIAGTDTFKSPTLPQLMSFPDYQQYNHQAILQNVGLTESTSPQSKTINWDAGLAQNPQFYAQLNLRVTEYA